MSSVTFASDSLSDFFDANLPKEVRVFGVLIRATADTEDRHVLWAANVLAAYLDNDEDGEVDNPAVVEAMIANGSILIMAANENGMPEPPQSYFETQDRLVRFFEEHGELKAVEPQLRNLKAGAKDLSDGLNTHKAHTRRALDEIEKRNDAFGRASAVFADLLKVSNPALALSSGAAAGPSTPW